MVSISGDSAFGFSATEIETAARYRLPIIVIVFNNSGIYSGMTGTEALIQHMSTHDTVQFMFIFTLVMTTYDDACV